MQWLRKNYRQVLVLLACLLSTFVAAGLGYSPRGLYTAPIAETLQVSRTAYNASYSVVSVLNILVSMNIARIKSWVRGYKGLVLVGFGAIVASSLLASVGRSLPVFYVCTFLTMIGFSFCSTLTMTGIVGNWFPRNNGLVLGIVVSGTSLGGALFSPIVSKWIATVGWRTSYLYTAAIIGAAMLFVLFALQESPEADQAKQAGKGVKRTKYQFDRGLLRDRNFYMVGFAMALMPISLQAISLNAATIILDAGHTTEVAGSVSSVMFVFCAIGKVLSGWLNDRLGLPKMRAILIVCGCIGVLSLIFAKNTAMLYSYAVFYGIGQSLAMLFMPLHIRYLYPGRDPAEIMGMMSFFGLFGGTVGTPLISFGYELTGSYTGVLIVVAASLALCGGFAMLTKPHKAACKA